MNVLWKLNGLNNDDITGILLKVVFNTKPLSNEQYTL
jgi:hypothetical protein